VLVCIRDAFKELILELHREGAWNPYIPLPSNEDIAKAFVLADTDESGLVSEKEFMVLFELIMSGAAEGLGGAAGSGGSFFDRSADKAKSEARRRESVFQATLEHKAKDASDDDVAAAAALLAAGGDAAAATQLPGGAPLFKSWDAWDVAAATRMKVAEVAAWPHPPALRTQKLALK